MGMRDRFWEIKFYVETHKQEIKLYGMAGVGSAGMLACSYIALRNAPVTVNFTPEALEFLRTAEKGYSVKVKTPFLQPTVNLVKVASRSP